MKNLFKGFFAALAATLALAACGAGNAQAQTIPGVYKSATGIVVGSVKDAISVHCVTGAAYAMQGNFYLTNYDDSTGAVCAKLTSYASANGWLQMGTTNNWFNPAKLGRTECVGGKSKLRYNTYYDSNYFEMLNDSCSIANQMATRAN